jgi:glyoxylase-like metal-dependent hydrolase (beta-lactamase superfamily II)
VIDPQRDIDQYLADAEQLGCTIAHVFLTHMHADFIAGHLELRDRVGATIHLGAQARAEYAFTPMVDEDEVTLGSVRLSVLETAGHSPESISILVFDPDHGKDRPYAVLTGDTLFIGDVGRPDLRTSLGWSADRLASMLYDSLRDKLLPLPDDTLVYPAHGAGSLCGKHLSTDTVSTIGEQRKYNYALQPMSRERFIEIVTADQPDTPAYFGYDAALNSRERPTLNDALPHELQPLPLEQLLEQVESGAQLLDTRDHAEFEGAHIREALNIGLDGKFATWCGTILDHKRSVVLVADPGREIESGNPARKDRLRHSGRLPRRRDAATRRCPSTDRADRTDHGQLGWRAARRLARAAHGRCPYPARVVCGSQPRGATSGREHGRRPSSMGLGAAANRCRRRLTAAGGHGPHARLPMPKATSGGIGRTTGQASNPRVTTEPGRRECDRCVWHHVWQEAHDGVPAR